jgi:hypothetical protein
MVQNSLLKRIIFIALIILAILTNSCGKKAENPDDKFAELKKPEKDKINGIYFIYFDGNQSLDNIGLSKQYPSSWQTKVNFLGQNIGNDSGAGVFGCMKLDLTANLIKIFLPLQKESFTYPVSSEYEINKDQPKEANLVITMKTPLSDIKFTGYGDNNLGFELGDILRKEKYNGKELKSEEDCKEFSLKVLDSCKVQRKKGEYFISEPDGWDLRKDLTAESEILIHLPLNAKVMTEEYETNWNKSEVSWKKVRYDGGEGYVDSIHLEKTPSHCYDPNISAKRILSANAEWGGSYFESGVIIYATESVKGDIDFEIYSPSYEDTNTIDDFKFQKDSLKFVIHHISRYESEILSDSKYTMEVPFSRFHMLTPWNRVLEYDPNFNSNPLPKK